MNPASRRGNPRALHGFLLGIVLLTLFSLPTGACADQLGSLQTPAVSVYYEQALSGAAREIAAMYSPVKIELETTLGLHADFKPTAVLLKDRAAFEQVTGSRLIVAYAVPGKMLMVFDYPRASTDPFSTRAILKHELCHLILHRHVPSIPRWLDEGICQWASEGLAELLSERRGTSLSWASLGGSLMPLKSLDLHFPQDERGLVLAYDQSRSVVDYIAARYGRNSIPTILTSLEHGMSLEDAFRVSLGVSPSEIERQWRHSIETWPAIMTFVMANIYTILFSFAALSTVAGYVRYRIRRRRQLREVEEEVPFPDDF